MKTLAIMAAGLGSRYGGLKQLDSIDANGYSIIDYSIYDAIQVGFNEVVFIIRKELYKSFIERFSDLHSDRLKISYVFQETTDVPEEFAHITREKPWGTGHALLALRHSVKNNFALINADDFYGRAAFQVLHDTLFTSEDINTYAMVGYKLHNTLSPFGTVSRGQCYIDNTNRLLEVIERRKIDKKDAIIRYISDNTVVAPLDGNTIVSMNFWGFTPSIFKHGEQLFKEFLEAPYNHTKREFYIPSIVNSLVNDKSISVKVLNTDSKWYGITYKKDKKQIVEAIEKMRVASRYPKDLWQDISIPMLFNQFSHEEVYKNHIAITSGHINDTYKIDTVSGNQFILQRINTHIFPKVNELIKNKVAVSDYLKRNSNYNVSNYIKTSGAHYVLRDNNGSIWTVSSFIENTSVFLVPKDKVMAREAGLLLGDFHRSMRNYSVSSLSEIIPGFHNLSYRKKQFREAIAKAGKHVVEEVRDLLNVIKQLKHDADYLDHLKSTGQLPTRVTHNDAKLSNMLFDQDSLKAAAIIDFDTIMPGIIHYDIGDAIRSVCATADENEVDIGKIGFNIDYYKAFMEGFLSVIANELSEIEKETLPLSIKYMLFEQSLRFLTDYLNGNTYYKVDYPTQNLIRTKNQLQLLRIVDEHSDAIKDITTSILNHYQ